MKSLFFISILGLLTSCASRTQYQPHDGYSGGYSENLNGDMKLARFAGNALTYSSDADLYSQFRAIEICAESNKPITLVLEKFDLSHSEQVQKSSTSGSFIGKTYFGSTNSWVETYTYPTFETYFVCTDKAYTLSTNLNVISKEDMKLLVKDLKGALQVSSVKPDSPNFGILKEGDIIIKMNDERVEYQGEIIWGLEKAKNKNSIPVVLYREGELLKLNVKSKDITNESVSYQNKITGTVCSVSEVSGRPICNGRNLASEGFKMSCSFADKLNARNGCALIKLTN